MQVKITVTQDDIDQGLHSCSNCPIALAFARAFNVPHGDVNVASKWIVEGVGFGDMPDVGCNFIRDFDNNRPVKPFYFFVTV
jgi:hypothetical protein